MLVGAEGVVESGGIINKLGSYQMAIAAKAHGIPFYVAAESYKVSLDMVMCKLIGSYVKSTQTSWQPRL